MKLKLTPELFILQDAVKQPEKPTRQDEEKKKEINQTDLEHKLKKINRTKRFIETPEFQLLNCSKFNEQNNKNNNELDSLQLNQPFSQINQINQLNQKQVQPSKQPSITDFIPYYSLHQNIIENNGLSYDKRFIKRRPTRDIIQSDIRCVTLNKEKYGSGFGLTIKGGLEFNKPLVISGINRSSAADKCKSLFLGDLIVELNGQSTYPLSLTHEQAMKSIKSGGHKLYLTVKHVTMYNRPIGRIWHRQLSFCLNNCENKAENWSDPNSLINQDINQDKLDSAANFKNEQATFFKNQFSTSSVNQDLQLTDSEQYSNCETTTLSNLTALDKDDLHTPSPLNDEGVYTGLSNDALSSSECTSDASGFSSDYVQSLTKQNLQCKNFNSLNQNSNLHQQTICSSSCCKNKKNNNCCTKCIVNKNQTCYSSLEQQIGLKQEKTMNSISKENEFKLPVVDQNNKENMISYPIGSLGSVDSCNSVKRGNSEYYQTNGNQETSTCSLSSTDNLVDIVSVSLINCYFTKYILNTDSMRRNGMQVQWYNLHNQSKLYENLNNSDANQMKSIDMSSAVINFNDTSLSQQFQQQINHYLSKLNESYMFSFNRGLSPQNRILFMGWVSLALPTTNSLQFTQLTSIDYKWKPKYMIIKGGELLLYDCVPDYLLDKIKEIPYANDTLMEFNDLSNLLVNKNGTLAFSITLNSPINKPKSNTQHNRKSTRPLTRHLSIRGRDYSFNPLDRFNEQRILTETNNNQKKTTNNRLICSLTRNLSLKTSKENRYKQMNSKFKSANPHCTLPRNQFIDHQTTSSQDKKNLKRAGAESNLFKPSDFQTLNQQSESNCQTILQKAEWKNKPIIFKAYQSVLRQLKPDEQLDKRENCLLALTYQSDMSTTSTSFVNRLSNSMSTFGKQSTNCSTEELENSTPNVYHNGSSNSSSRKNSQDDQNRSIFSSSMIAYLSVEHADNISQILKSWAVATMHSVQQLAKKSFPVISEGRYCCLTFDWDAGFTLYEGSNVKWNFKFSQLKNSSDDGCNTLWLSFQSIKHQPVRPVLQRTNALNLVSFSNQSDNNSSLNSSMDSVDQYSQRGLNRALTPNSFDSSNLNGSTMNSTLSSNNQLNNNDYSTMNSNYLQTNRTEFRIKKSIETKELTCSNLQHLIYCMHNFLSAKVTSVAMPNQQQASLTGILV